MKQFYLLLLGATIALTASAQPKLLSSYTIDPTTNEKTWQSGFSFNEKGDVTEERNTYYYNDGSTYESKSLYYYDDQGRELRREDYSGYNGEWVMTGKREFLEWGDDGQPSVWIEYDEDENNPGVLVQNMKYVVHKYNQLTPLDYDVYWPDGAGGWTPYATIRGEEDSQGEIAKLVEVIEWGGETFHVTLEYEYDDHRWLTKETYTSDAWNNYVRTYENFYGSDGNIEKRNRYLDGVLQDTQFYTWGDPTAIQGVKSSVSGTAPWFDLNGRRLPSAPTKKGLYIHNGKKIVIR